jgi:hypothetical protein
VLIFSSSFPQNFPPPVFLPLIEYLRARKMFGITSKVRSIQRPRPSFIILIFIFLFLSLYLSIYLSIYLSLSITSYRLLDIQLYNWHNVLVKCYMISSSQTFVQLSFIESKRLYNHVVFSFSFFFHSLSLSCSLSISASARR